MIPNSIQDMSPKGRYNMEKFLKGGTAAASLMEVTRIGLAGPTYFYFMIPKLASGD